MTRSFCKRCKPLFLTGVLLFSASWLTSCTSIITGTVINPAVSNLQKQSDVELVCEGAAAYLLMIDSLIEGNPANKELLLTGTKAFSGSAAALTSCNATPQRIEAISSKAKIYGQRLLSFYLPIEKTSSNELDTALSRLTKAEAPLVFWGTFGWLSWVQQQQGAPAAMADLIVIEKIMSRILTLDDTVEYGSPHIFFGALYGSKPAMIGGDLELSRSHFERALEISNRSFLLAQTTYAATYCRMAFNQKLHDSLLHEVLRFPLEKKPALMLTNQIAKRKAQVLLDEGFFD